MRVTMFWTKRRVKGSIPGCQATNIEGVSKMTCDMGTEKCTGLTVPTTKVIGITGSKREKAN